MNVTGLRNQDSPLPHMAGRFQYRRGLAFGIIMLAALLAFEAFNYSTTDFALSDLLGNPTFLGLRWATILSLAFCGIDFAGIARLFSGEPVQKAASEVWYLFGAWLLAATMNAMLTWWGVSIVIADHSMRSSSVVDVSLLTRIVPVFVAIMVWVIRILLIGSLSYAGERLTSHKVARPQPNRVVPLHRPHGTSVPAASPVSQAAHPAPALQAAPRTAPQSLRPAGAASQITRGSSLPRPEPTYQNLSMQARPANLPNYASQPRR